MKRTILLTFIVCIFLLIGCSKKEAVKNITQAEENNEVVMNAEKQDIYLKAIEEYNNADFENAKKDFLSIVGYEDTEKYLNYIILITNVQGEWKIITNDYFMNQVTTNYDEFPQNINIDKFNIEYDENKKKLRGIFKFDEYLTVADENADGYQYCFLTKGYKVTEENKYSKVLILSKVEFENGEILVPNTQGNALYVCDDYVEEYRKPTETTTSKLNTKEPQIGMTSEEVEKESWGKPTKKNVNVYSWGTYEQWVYSNNRFLYFENDKVTSISYSE